MGRVSALELVLHDAREARARRGLDPSRQAGDPGGARQVAVDDRDGRQVVEAQRHAGDVARLGEQPQAVGEQPARDVDLALA